MYLEVLIWTMVGVASLLVGLMLWRGEGKPKIERRDDESRL